MSQRNESWVELGIHSNTTSESIPLGLWSRGQRWFFVFKDKYNVPYTTHSRPDWEYMPVNRILDLQDLPWVWLWAYVDELRSVLTAANDPTCTKPPPFMLSRQNSSHRIRRALVHLVRKIVKGELKTFLLMGSIKERLIMKLHLWTLGDSCTGACGFCDTFLSIHVYFMYVLPANMRPPNTSMGSYYP